MPYNNNYNNYIIVLLNDIFFTENVCRNIANEQLLSDELFPFYNQVQNSIDEVLLKYKQYVVLNKDK